MSLEPLFTGLEPLLLAASRLQVARLVAGGCFAVLLLALGVGVLRARRQAQSDAVDAVLEVDFLRIERELTRELDGAAQLETTQREEL